MGKTNYKNYPLKDLLIKDTKISPIHQFPKHK